MMDIEPTTDKARLEEWLAGKKAKALGLEGLIVKRIVKHTEKVVVITAVFGKHTVRQQQRWRQV